MPLGIDLEAQVSNAKEERKDEKNLVRLNKRHASVRKVMDFTCFCAHLCGEFAILWLGSELALINGAETLS